MFRHYFYLTFGVLAIGGLAAAEWRGWTPLRPTRVSDVPRTVRANPGSYRPHYTFIGSGARRGK